MHPLYERADRLSHDVIGGAIEVHRDKGPGLIESIYERCLIHELSLRGIQTVNQKLVRIEYKGLVFEEPLRFDLLAEDCLLIENKWWKSSADPQGATLELHEAAQHPAWSRHQLP